MPSDPKPRINWTRNETLIALDLYLRHNGKVRKGGAAVQELSHQLRHLGAHSGVKLTPKYRNPDGVYMKLMNLRTADPSRGGTGLAHGANLEKAVWAEFGHRPDELSGYVANLLKKAPTAPVMRAVEALTALRRAHKDWAHRFAEGTSSIGNFHADVLWDEDQQYWADFLPEAASDGTSFMTLLGIQDTGFRANVLVEVNLPFVGNNSNIQGAVARDEHGHRWVLHQGRLHPGIRRISSAEFGALAGAGSQVVVQFKNGSTRPYYRVANIDAEPTVMRAQLGDFLRLSERVRINYTRGAELAAVLTSVEQRERGLFPETSGTFVRPAQAEKLGERWHGNVFRALVAALEDEQLSVANERIGRYGPDLYTNCKTPKLFEIKTSAAPPSVQQGVGQLFLYEKILGREHGKVLVLPERPTDELANCLRQLEIRLLQYRRYKGRITFDPDDVRDAVA